VRLYNPSQPNVIIILADDLGWKDAGCTGSEIYETPNIDRLAGLGIIFENSYASSCVCSPTRASIMTGKYPARLKLTSWIKGGGGAKTSNHLALEEKTIAEAFSENGYTTGLIGKWHLGNVDYWPTKQGFQVTVGEPHNGSPAGGYYLPNRMKLSNVKKGDYLTDILSREAVTFIEDHREKPFFLYQSYHSVHTPTHGKLSYTESEKRRMAKHQDKWNPKYSAMVKSLDDGVGAILNSLIENDLLENTIILFSSDNGGFKNVTNNFPLREGKGYNYEGGNRIPTIIYDPRSPLQNTTCETPIISNDYYPTLLDLCDLQLQPNQHLDGVSFKKLILEKNADLERENLFWHFPHFSPQGGMPSSVILRNNWKLIEFYKQTGVNNYELYDLSDDPSEQNNLVSTELEKTELLKRLLQEWKSETDAELLPKHGNFPRWYKYDTF